MLWITFGQPTLFCYIVLFASPLRADNEGNWSSPNRPVLTLTVEPNEVTNGLNQSVLLRCLLSRTPTDDDSVYVIWRFRHSREAPPPTNWAFMHQDDDIARCPEPPGSCELVNQYGTLKSGLAELNSLSGIDGARIAQRQLHTLRIRRTSSNFDGTFQCYVLLNLDALEARTNLRVLSAPRHPTSIHMIESVSNDRSLIKEKENSLTKIGENKWRLTAGKLYYFICRVDEANPRAQVTWIVRRTDGTLRTLRMSQSTESKHSKWRPFEKFLDVKQSYDLSYLDDGGTLECHAENGVGKASSNPSFLELSFAPLIQKFPSSVIRVLENGNLSIDCVVIAKPRATIRWLDGGNHSASNSSRLYLAHASRNGPSEFTCVASNAFGQSQRIIRLDLLYPPVVQVQSNITANVGERLEVACRVDANPTPESIYWSFRPHGHRHVRTQTTAVNMQGNQLLLASVRREHEGLYTCHAVTEPELSKLIVPETGQFQVTDRARAWWRTKATSSASLRLVVNYAPGKPLVTILSHKPITEGSPVQIQCLVNDQEPGVPEPHFHWIRRSLPELLSITQTVIQSPSMQLQAMNGGSTLRINMSKVVDSGTYTCYARNAVGISPPSKIVLNVQGKPSLLDGPPLTQTFIAIQPPPLVKVEHPPSAQSATLQSKQQTDGTSLPSVVLTCNFVSSTPTVVQWFFKPHAGDNSNRWHALQPNSSPTSSVLFGYQLDTHASLLSEVNLWHIRSTLTVPQTQLTDSGNGLCNACALQYAITLLQRERMDATYRCEATNNFGKTGRQSKISVVYPPSPLGFQDQLIAVPAKEMGQLVGPIICQFSARPSIEQVIWWQKVNNLWEKIYQSSKLKNPIELQDNSEYLVVSGSPALMPHSIFENQSIRAMNALLNLDELHAVWNSKQTFFTALWIKHFTQANSTMYQCFVANQLGNRTLSRTITVPSKPHKITEVHVDGITWTTVRLSWLPGFHGIQIPVTPPYSRTANLTAAVTSVNTIRQKLQTIHNQQCAERSKGQSFIIHLTDHGYRAQTDTMGDQSELGASWSELSPTESDHSSSIRQIRLRIGSSVYVNLTGLLPSHVYTITIRGVNVLGEGPASDPIRITTPDINVHMPPGITVDRSTNSIRLPPDNPALCAKIERSVVNTELWLPVEFPSLTKSIQTADGQYKANYPVELKHGSNCCIRLSWTAEMRVPVEPKGVYRIRYCHTGNPSKCSSVVYPSKDVPIMILFIVGGVCVLAVSILLTLLTHFAWSHLKRREAKRTCTITGLDPHSAIDTADVTWLTPNSGADQPDDTGLMTQFAPLLTQRAPMVSDGRLKPEHLIDKRLYGHGYTDRCDATTYGPNFTQSGLSHGRRVLN